MTADPRRQFDASVAELTHRCRDDFEAGASVADDEIRGLCSLAEAIGRGLTEWRALTSPLSLCQSLDARRAGVILIETVFDEVMEPDAWRVLADAFALVELDP
jgi:hypothetical protein